MIFSALFYMTNQLLPFFTLVSLSRKHRERALIVSFKELLTILIGHYLKARTRLLS